MGEVKVKLVYNQAKGYTEKAIASVIEECRYSEGDGIKLRKGQFEDSE
jgi:hypothetical protein